MPAGAQTREALSQKNENSEEINPCFPILPIIRTALDGTFTWHPARPLEIPPDSFSLNSGKAAVIQLDTEEEQFVCEWNQDGKLIQFPVFHDIPLMASVQFNKDGEAAQIRLRGRRKTKDESEDAESIAEPETEISIDIEIIESKEGEASLARIHRDGEYYFAVFHYRNDYASETWYDAEGDAQGLLVTKYIKTHRNTLILMTESVHGNGENRITYDYDSWGNTSRVNAEAMSISVLYNADSRPVYLEKTLPELPEGDVRLDEENDQSFQQKEHVTFQWDERNLLVSVKRTPEDAAAEKRYEYTLDAEGNWTERREINMMRLGSYLFPSEGSTIRRTIQYIDQ